MKFVKCFAFAFAALLSLGTSLAQAQSLSPSTKWHWNKGSIEIETPARPAGQKDVLGLRVPAIKTVRIGLVGLGMRGPGAVENFCVIPGVEVVALCDYEEARAERCQQYLKKAGLLPLPSTLVRMVTRNSAPVPTSTSFMWQPTGHTTSLWQNALCSTVSTWLTKFLQP